LPGELAHLQEIAAVELRAERSERVSILRRVDTLEKAGRAATCRVHPDNQHVPKADRRLALHANQARVHVKDQVVTLVRGNRNPDSDAELDRSVDDRCFGDGTLLSRCQH
jgi:hypothetical protein